VQLNDLLKSKYHCIPVFFHGYKAISKIFKSVKIWSTDRVIIIRRTEPPFDCSFCC